MDAKFKATRIKWDVDKEDVEESFSLPNEIDVPEEIVEEATIPSLETFTELSVTLGKTPDFFLLGHIRDDIVGNIEDSLKLCSKERLNLIYKIVELLKD